MLALRTVCGWLKREDWIEKPGRLTKMVLPYMAKLSFPPCTITAGPIRPSCPLPFVGGHSSLILKKTSHKRHQASVVKGEQEEGRRSKRIEGI